MTSTLPAQIRGLLNNTITWEGFLGQDGFTDEQYTEPRQIRCWIEEKGGEGGIQRQSSAGRMDEDPKVDVYFEADGLDGQKATMRDRWTYSVNGQVYKTQADRISIMYGPDSTPWLVTVTL